MDSKSINFEQHVKAPRSQVFRAFTNATALREWLCDVATVDPIPGGRIYLAWNNRYYSSGEFISLDVDGEISFTWNGRGEPEPTRVQVTLIDQDEGTLITLTHSGIGNGGSWSKAAQEFTHGWQVSLENLASVLETGEDLRFTSRPMLGISLNDFTPEQADILGVPVIEGIRIDSVIDGMGAQSAGLVPNDVIVGMAGTEIHGFQDLSRAIHGKVAGDQVDVEIYRGPEKMIIPMELSRRPIPDIPDTTAALAHYVENRYTNLTAEMDKFFEGVSEWQVSYKPSPDDWNIKEILAHLIHGERLQQIFIAELVSGYERWADDFGGNLDASVKATTSVYPTLQGILDALKTSFKETVALYTHLPPEFADQKASFWRMAYNALEGPYHFYSHIEQMQSILEASVESQPGKN
jgi:uncharacterized protein YndB with AHSA1/START domain